MLPGQMEARSIQPAMKVVFQLIRPQIAVFGGVLAISFAAPLIKLASAPAPIIAFYRLLFAAVATWLLAGGRLASVRRRSRWCIASAGVCLGLHFAVWIASLNITSLFSSVALVTLQPVIVALASRWLFQERLSNAAYAGIALALGGGVAIAGVDVLTGGGSLYGDLLAFVGAIFISGYLVLGRLVRSEVDTWTYTFWVYLAAALSLLPIIWSNQLSWFSYGIWDWLIFLTLALVCTLLGHTVFNWALAYISPTVVTVAILGEPVGACLWDYLIFGQLPNWQQLVAGGLLLAGLAWFMAVSGPTGRKDQETSG